MPPWVPKGHFITPQLPAPPLPTCAEPVASCQGLGLPVEAEAGSHRTVGLLLPGVLGGFAWLRGALHMHRVDDVKEIFHHSDPLQRDALGLRQAICPLRQGGQAVLVSGLMVGESWALRPGQGSGQGWRCSPTRLAPPLSLGRAWDQREPAERAQGGGARVGARRGGLL